MQFITTGNRIAVENFVLGDLYTITFTNGTYINSACIGIGENFVSFQRNEPELLFTLNMETAELVSSIDLYAGGTGTNNYNDLTNKPQINDVELVGNKSLSDLGIQPTISDIDTIRSGAAAGATAVQPAALADYQPIISDLDTIRSGAAAGATAVQPAALAGYQTLIDSSHKLDADLVDDTSSTHKFATAAQLSQIETNKNNILSITAEITPKTGDITLGSAYSSLTYNTKYIVGIGKIVTLQLYIEFPTALTTGQYNEFGSITGVPLPKYLYRGVCYQHDEYYNTPLATCSLLIRANGSIGINPPAGATNKKYIINVSYIGE